MLTIRVERGGGDHAREVFECDRYRVSREKGRGALSLEYYSEKWHQAITVEPGDVAFVMNNLGNTIDTIRPKRPAAAAVAGG